MSIRKSKLSQEDAKAVDLILDQGDPKNPMTRPANNISQPRLSSATKLLRMLDNLPADEPPADLTAKTMRFIAKASQESVARHTPTTTHSSAHLH